MDERHEEMNEAECRQALWSCMKMAGASKEEMDRFKMTNLEMIFGEGNAGTILESICSPDIVAIFTPERLAKTNEAMLKSRATRHLFEPKNGTSSEVPKAWMEHFIKLKDFYGQYGHLSTRDKTLNSWLTFQIANTGTLSTAQLQLLESINFKTARWTRNDDEEQWNKQFLALKKALASKEKMPKFVSRWLSSQRKKAHLGQLSNERRKQLEELKVSLSMRQSNTRIGKFDPSRKRISCDETWLKQLRKLKQFHSEHGHSHVPFRYPEDPQLARWVSYQRNIYRALQSNGHRLSGEDWVKMLEELGFAWSIGSGNGQRGRKA